MDERFAGKLALVTAFGQSYARAMAKQLIVEGARVILAGNDDAFLENVKGELDIKSATRLFLLVQDAESEEAGTKLGEAAAAVFGRLDILVTTVDPPAVGSLGDLSVSDWTHYNLQAMRMVHTARAMFPLMEESEEARMLAIAPSSLRAAVPGFLQSNMLRGTTAELIKSLSIEWARHNILVNAIFPGRTAADRTSYDDFAKAARYFISADNTYMTGSVVHIEGGSVRL